MRQRRHKRKANHIVIVTSNLADAGVRQYRVRRWIVQTAAILLFLVIGGLIGYFAYEGQIWESIHRKNQEGAERVLALEQEKKDLQAQVAELNEKVQLLSNTVNEKVKSEAELSATLEKQRTPVGFPLTGSASITEAAEGEPMCVFQAAAGITVVATATGTVQTVVDDTEYGHSVRIDHGNGYVTIYRNKGDVIVKQGDVVVQGSAIYVIGKDNAELGYQMMKDDVYVNPMDMLAIDG